MGLTQRASKQGTGFETRAMGLNKMAWANDGSALDDGYKNGSVSREMARFKAMLIKHIAQV